MAINVPSKSVPRIDGTSVELQPGPIALTSTQGRPRASQDQGRLSEQVIQTGRDLQDLQAKNEGRADNVWLLNAQNQIRSKQIEIESAAKKRKGQDSFNLHAETEEELKTFISTMSPNNDTQRTGLGQIADGRQLSMKSTITRHVDNQFEAVEEQESVAFKQNLTNSAMNNYDDPTEFDVDKEFLDASIRDDIKRLGLKSSAAEAYKLEQQTQFHMNVISQILSDDQNDFAQKYAEHFSKELSAEAKNKLTPIFKEASLRVDSQIGFDTAMNQFDNFPERVKWAQKNLTGQLRDDVVSRLEKQAKRENLFDKEIAEESQKEDINLIEKRTDETGSLIDVKEVIGTVKWSELTLQERMQRRDYAAFVDPTNQKNPVMRKALEEKRTAVLGSLWSSWQGDKQNFVAQTGFTFDPKTEKNVAGKLNLEALKPLIGDTEYNRFKRFQTASADIFDKQVEDAMKIFDIKFSQEIIAAKGDLDLAVPEDVANIKLAQIRFKNVLRDFIDTKFQALIKEDKSKNTSGEHQKIINSAWLKFDVNRADQELFEAVTGPFGQATLPFFVTEELIRKGEVLKRGTNFSEESQRYFHDELGISPSARFNFDTGEFFLSGKALQTYIRKGNRRQSSDNTGRKVTGAWVRLDGSTARTTGQSDAVSEFGVATKVSESFIPGVPSFQIGSEPFESFSDFQEKEARRNRDR